MKVGGAAEWLLEPATPEEFRRALCAALAEGFVLHVDGEPGRRDPALGRVRRRAAPLAHADTHHTSAVHTGAENTKTDHSETDHTDAGHSGAGHSGAGHSGAGHSGADRTDTNRTGADPTHAGRFIRILGGGANLIVDDGVLPGVVIATDRIRRLFRPEPDSVSSAADALEMSPRTAPAPREQGLRFVAWCGVSMPKLVNAAAELGWSGVEGLAGVPGNVGGGIAMNAGGKWGEMWDVVERVLVIDERGEMREEARADCSPRYRNGGLGRNIVAAAVLHFRLDEIASVKERGRSFLLEKNRAQPVTAASAGCVFKNPDKEKSGGRSAGQLIEQCGLKGRSVGQAMVSPLHGNFIVNRGQASATDVLTLIDEVRAIVARKTGLELELEVKIWRARTAQ